MNEDLKQMLIMGFTLKYSCELFDDVYEYIVDKLFSNLTLKDRNSIIYAIVELEKVFLHPLTDTLVQYLKATLPKRKK
jgi:hypothetical protein